MLILLLICLISFTTASTVDLYTHKWCPPCRKAISVLNKVKQGYPTIEFKEHSYSDRTVLYKGEGRKQVDVLPFPSIVFNCSEQKITYQNDLTVKEVSYWLEAICLGQLPTCTESINQELYHIAVQPSESIQTLVEQMQSNPHIRICQASNANYTQEQTIELLKQSKKKTMFLDYFDHNIRNYLIKSEKLAVVLVTSNVNTSKATSFFGAYMSLLNLPPDQNYSQPFHFDMVNEHKSQLIFLGLCLNKNISKCVADPNRQQQVKESQKYIVKLLSFMDLNVVEDSEYIFAFRFKNNKFQHYFYHQSLGILDQKFLFWLNDILEGQPTRKEQRKCLWNSLIHRVSDRSLQDIQTHSFLLRMLNKIKQKNEQNKLIVSKVARRYYQQAKFTLCLSGQFPLSFQSNKNIQEILTMIEEHLEEKIRSSQQL